jgi:acetoin utilization deacetylase AcuC-like enzyme
MAVNQPVFLVYDDAMLAHAHIPHLQKKHPEKPSRITTIYELLGALGLLERCDCATIKPRRATDAEILGAHSAEHLAEVRQMTAEVAAEPENRELREPDGPGGIYYSPEALAAGLLAAGIVVEMSLTLLKLADAERARTAAAPAPAAAVQAQSSEAYAPGGPALAPSVPTPMPPCALALVRPPGHHAGYDDTPGHRAEGFCARTRHARAACTSARMRAHPACGA